MFMSSSSDEFTDWIHFFVTNLKRRWWNNRSPSESRGWACCMFLVSAQSKRARSYVTCSPAWQSWGTMVAVQWRVQGRGPGGPPPVIFRTKWGPRVRKNCFETGPPPLPQSLDAPPPPPEGLDPSLQSNNRSFCWFLAAILVSSGSADKSACSTIKL